MLEATGEWPFGFVWSYDPTATDKAQIWGHPVAVSDEAKALCDRLPSSLK